MAQGHCKRHYDATNDGKGYGKVMEFGKTIPDELGCNFVCALERQTIFFSPYLVLLVVCL